MTALLPRKMFGRIAIALGVLLAGGCGGDTGGDDDAGMPSPFAWEVAIDDPRISANRQVVPIPDNRLLVPGGGQPRSHTNNFSLLDVEAGTAGDYRTGGTSPLAFMTATPLENGLVLIAGNGRGDEFEAPYPGVGSECYLIDPDMLSVTETGALEAARSHHVAARLADGRVLVAGGAGAGPDDGRPVLGSAEIYEPDVESWQPTGPLTEPRYAATATELSDGRVVVAGGVGGSGERLASAELYDPSTGEWSAAGDMATPRAWHVARRLPSGRVLVAGGQDSGSTVTATAELFDPETGEWMAAAALPMPSADAAALTLPSGRVLVTGGYAQFDTFEKMLGHGMVAVYGEQQDRWWTMESLAEGRFAHSLVWLSDGRVAAVAGRGEGAGRFADPVEVTTEPLR